FTINSASGAISNLQPLDYETRNQYIFSVVATDNGFPSRSAVVSVTVNVNDLDDNIPIFDQSYTGYILEGVVTTVTQEGTNVPLRVIAIDADPNPQITYSFEANNNDFSINPSSGTISSSRQLNYEDQRSFTFYVTTTQGANSIGTVPNARAFVTVNIIDVNDNRPSISVNQNEQTIPEDFVSYQVSQGASTDLAFVFSGSDLDAPNTANSRISYSIASVREVGTNTPVTNDMFRMYDPLTGTITAIRTFADRGATGYDPTTNPVFQGSVDIDHNEPINNVIYTFSATDSDDERFGTLRDQLTGEADATPYFSFQRSIAIPNEVQVVVQQTLRNDVNAALQYRLVFTFTDGGYGSVQKTTEFVLTVNVARNLNDPRWLTTPQNPVQISENLQLEVPVATLQIQDADQLAPHNLMDCGISGDANALQYFRTETDNNLDRCLVYMKRSPASMYLITFQATMTLTDRGEPTPRRGNDLVVNFEIIRNDDPPLFFNLDSGVYRATINENSPVGTSVKIVNARDSSPQPENSQVTYEIIGDDNALSIFRISDQPTTENGAAVVDGFVQTQAVLTTEGTDVYTVS
ncbi:STAN-like protein, partial [Mya arenaria]